MKMIYKFRRNLNMSGFLTDGNGHSKYFLRYGELPNFKVTVSDELDITCLIEISKNGDGDYDVIVFDEKEATLKEENGNFYSDNGNLKIENNVIFFDGEETAKVWSDENFVYLETDDTSRLVLLGGFMLMINSFSGTVTSESALPITDATPDEETKSPDVADEEMSEETELSEENAEETEKLPEETDTEEEFSEVTDGEETAYDDTRETVGGEEIFETETTENLESITDDEDYEETFETETTDNSEIITDDGEDDEISEIETEETLEVTDEADYTADTPESDGNDDIIAETELSEENAEKTEEEPEKTDKAIEPEDNSDYTVIIGGKFTDPENGKTEDTTEYIRSDYFIAQDEIKASFGSKIKIALFASLALFLCGLIATFITFYYYENIYTAKGTVQGGGTSATFSVSNVVYKVEVPNGEYKYGDTLTVYFTADDSGKVTGIYRFRPDPLIPAGITAVVLIAVAVLLIMYIKQKKE